MVASTLTVPTNPTMMRITDDVEELGNFVDLPGEPKHSSILV
jgi:hypothetical protein